jgi:DNA-binding MarR family transcriptional regulator
MNVQTKILDYLTANPNKSAEQITAAISGKPNTVKVILHKMQARNQLIRERHEREVKTKQGPQKIYVYRMPTV